MLLKRKKATTPGSRHQLLAEKSLLDKSSPIKTLLSRIIKKGGRNANGHISIRHRGGGNRRLYRNLNWTMKKLQGIVVGIEYDPNRTGLLARLFNLETNEYHYTLANKYMYPGTVVRYAEESIDIRIGNRLPLLYIPAGSIISLVGLNKKNWPLYARSAGTSCQLLQKGSLISKIRIPSGKIVYISSKTLATIGSIANETHNLQVIGKAGKNRLKGWRPHVRGVAMNPVDHPHGGGEGKTSGGRPSVTPWGKPTKGKPTSKKKKIKNKNN